MLINNKNQTISYKFIKSIVLVLLPFVFFMTILNMIIEYNYAKEDMIEEIKTDYSSFSASLKHAMWILDFKAINNISKGVLKIKGITGIKIVDKNGKVIIDSHKKNIQNKELFVKTKIIHNEFNDNYILGDITLYSDTKAIYDRLKTGWYIIAINTLIKFSVLVILIILTFKHILNKTLFQLIEQIEHTQFYAKNQKIIKTDNDSIEIVQLKNAFNSMINRINKSKNELVELNRTLERKVEQRTKELELTNKQLLDQIEKNRQFTMIGTTISYVSHQWKQPLSILGTQNSSLLAKIDYEPDMKISNIKKYILKQEKSIENINTTLDNIKMLFHTQQNINESIDITNLISEIKNYLIFENHNIKFRSNIEYNSKVYGNKNLFLHAISNIFQNSIDAFESTKIDPKIISIECINKDTNKLFLTIQDNAGGIQIKPITDIFKPTVTSKKLGTGIGMSFTKNIIESKFQGEINVINKNNGACFEIVLESLNDTAS